MTNHHRPSIRLFAALGFSAATLFAPSALAQPPDVGLSSVGSQRFGRPSLADPNVSGGDQFGYAFATGDFNGDGADDLATGLPYSDGPSAAPVDQCGAVVVRYGVIGKGLATGVAPTVLGQFVGPFNRAEAQDRFGFALTACNLNGDLYDDLVVGVPYESIAYGFDLESVSAGIVEVYYGTSAGIVPPASTTRQEKGDVLVFPPANTLFGFALACGDLNHDTHDDLAVGLPYRDIGSATNAGRVNIYAGSVSGLGAAALQLDQGFTDIDDGLQNGDRFGAVLGTGDFDGDGFADLAIGVPGETYDNPEPGSGAVHVVYGGEKGLGTSFDHLLFENMFGWEDGENLFGYALAVGNFDADAYDDLAIGAMGQEISVINNAGIVFEVFGSVSGLGPARSEGFSQYAILGGTAGENEVFGDALAAGDFDGDGVDDLAIGAPADDVFGTDDGTVSIIMGLAGTGLEEAPNRNRLLEHGLEGIPGDANEELVRFGDVLASGDFDGDDVADLAIGAPAERESNLNGVGSVTVLYGALFADGFESVGLHYWSDFAPHG